MGRFIVNGVGFHVGSDDVESSGSIHASAWLCLISSACTSPLVERRDPLGVGLRTGIVDCTVASALRVQTPGFPTDCSAVFVRYRAALECVQTRCKLCHLPGCADLVPYLGMIGCWLTMLSDRLTLAVQRYRSATLLLWVLSGPVLKHGPRSLTCARVIGIIET